MKKALSFVLSLITLVFFCAGTGVYADEPAIAAETRTPVTLPANPFRDVENGKWFTDGVLWCYKYGLMSGTSDENFSPDSPLSRAMFVRILYTADLAKDKFTKSSFSDVDAAKWYFNAVEWAFRNGYTSGTGNGLFGPDSPVTREQLAVFLFNYAAKKGSDVSARDPLTGFSDRGKVSSWAKTAVAWAVAEGFISGSGSKLDPGSPASRAQAAVIISAFLKKYGIQWDDGTVITARTCTVNGVTEFRSPDGAVTRVTYKAWHNYGYGTLTKAAACEVDGQRTFVCGVCGSKRIEVIPATGHRWDNGTVTKKPTCTETGVKLFTCNKCGGTRAESLDALGHKWNAGIVTKQPTCTAMGTKSFTCTICSAGRIEKIAALGHTTENGICSRCGEAVFPNNSEKLRYYLKANADRQSEEYAGALCMDCKNIVNNSNYFCTLTVIPKEQNRVMIDIYSKYFDTSSGEYAGTMRMTLTVPYISTSYHYSFSFDVAGSGSYKEITSGWITSANVSSDPNVNTVTGFGRYYGSSAQKAWFLREMNEILSDGLRAMNGKLFGTARLGGLTLKDMKFTQFD